MNDEDENGSVTIDSEPGIEGQYVDAEGKKVAQDSAERSVSLRDDTADEGYTDQAESEEGKTDEDREAIRVRRREERQLRKQRGKEIRANQERLISSLQRQNQDLAGRLAQVEQRQRGGDAASLESELRDSLSAVEEAKHHLKTATEAGDGEALVAATELYYAARRKAEQLGAVRQRMHQQRQQASQQRVDHEVTSKAVSWVAKHAWYDPNGQDNDSVVTRNIDNQVKAAGFDPRTDEYWEELSDRLAEELPHRANGNGQRQGSNSMGAKVSGGARNTPTGGSGKGFYLSPMRIQAMKDSGAWYDDARKAAVIKSYMEQDKGAKS